MQPLERRNIVAVDALFQLVKKTKDRDDIEGVSLIGGEPLLQAEGMAELAMRCQAEGLSVLLFTGYRYEEAKALQDSNIAKLLRHTDILVDGEYIASLHDAKRDWVGSTNQRVIFLSNFYVPGIEYAHGTHSTEIRILADRVAINGWPIEIGQESLNEKDSNPSSETGNSAET